MSKDQLQRIYLLRGLDRILYASEPKWKVGTFKQDEEDVGRLVLRTENIDSADELKNAIHAMDQRAERFRLAISKKTGCPLMLTLEKSDEPSFDPPGLISARSTLRISDYTAATVLPGEPPAEMEQLSEVASRWVLTLAETKTFSGYPDEILKRLYLLIEELSDQHTDQLTDIQRSQLQEVKWVRDFVSHPTCRNQDLCSFIASNLPDAVIATDPLTVQFDRTKVDHRNFVARYETKARDIVNPMLDAAIAAIRP